MNKYIIQIKETVGVREALEFYGVRFDRAGFALCPFHHEKTASLSVKNNLFWKCFGCGASGDIISFVMRAFGLNTYEAVMRINADFNLGLPIESGTARDRYEADKRFKEIDRKTKEKADRRKKLEDDYNRAFDFWCATYTAVRENGDFITENDSRAYASALNMLPYAEYRLDVAGMCLNLFLLEER